MRVVGDFASLRRFRSQLRRGSRSVPQITARLKSTTVRLAEMAITTSTDVHGRAFRPLVLSPGAPLLGLRGKFGGTSHEGGFRVVNTHPASGYHLTGTGIYGSRRKRIRPVRARALNVGGKFFASVKGVPKRKFFPTDGRLPNAWRIQYAEAAETLLARIFER